MSKEPSKKAIAMACPCSLLLAGLILLPLHAGAASFRPPDYDEYGGEELGVDASAWLISGFSYRSAMVGAAAGFAYPVLAEGFFENPVYLDALHVTVGFDFMRFSWDLRQSSSEVMYFVPNLGLRYEVYVSATVSLSTCVRLGPAISHGQHPDAGNRMYWSAGAAAAWDVLDWLAIGVEFDWSSFNEILRVGAVFRL